MTSRFSGTLRALLKRALENKHLQEAGTGVIRGIGEAITAKANDPEGLRRLADSLKDNAPAVVGAIVAGTPAQSHAEPGAVEAAKQIVAAEPAS